MIVKTFDDFNDSRDVGNVLNEVVDLSYLIDNTETPRYYTHIVKLNNNIFNNKTKKNRLEIPHAYNDFFGKSLAPTRYRYALDMALSSLYYTEKIGNLSGLVVDNKWVIFNRMNTNNSILSYTINYLNTYILDDQINVDVTNFDKIVPPLLHEYREELYGDETFMRGALLILLGTNRKDILATKFIIEFLTGHGCSNFEEGELGKESDMIGGVDLKYITKRGENRSAQIKNFRELELIGDLYYISGTAAPKIYPPEIDYYYFYNLSRYDKVTQLLIFSNGNVKIEGKSYVFPEKNKRRFLKW